MTNTISTIGIMFANNTDRTFPTVQEVVDTHGYLNLLGAELGEIGDWAAIAFDPRTLRYGEEDREAMDETNWDAIMGEISQEVAEVRYEYRYSAEDHGAVWQLDGLEEALEARVATISGVSGRILAVAPDAPEYPDDDDETPALLVDRMLHLQGRLADYPLLDESAYSEREWEAWQEYAPTALADEIREARRDGTFPEAWLDELEEDEDAVGRACSGLDYYYGFSGEYGPPMLDILASDDVLAGEEVTA